MITEQKLKSFEQSMRAAENDGERYVGIAIDDLTVLIAAARVANAVTAVEQEERDAKTRILARTSHYSRLTMEDRVLQDNSGYLVERARDRLASAMRRYV